MIYATGATGPTGAASCSMPWTPDALPGDLTAYVPPSRRPPAAAAAVREAEALLASQAKHERPNIGNSPAEITALIRFVNHRSQGGQMSFAAWYREWLRDGGAPSPSASR